MAFPTSVTVIPNTAGTEVLGLMGSGVGLSPIINIMGVDLNAVETKLGTGASTPAANQVLVGTGAGTSAWQGLTSAQLAAIISDETGSGALVFGTSPTIVTPTIASFANAQHDHSNAAGGGTISQAGLPTGSVVQMVSVISSALATGTTLIPGDDTIPQITEGTEFLTLSITPKAATNNLLISVNIFASPSVAADVAVALFQDSTANAIAAASIYQGVGTGRTSVPLQFVMVAGTTAATTFRVRVGMETAGTISFNGAAGARRYGATPKSSIVITEIKV